MVQEFSVSKASEGGFGPKFLIGELRREGINASHCHSPYVGQAGIRVEGTEEQINAAEAIINDYGW
jgi:hypothetical protein